MASCCVHPVKVSATGLTYVTRPSRSVVMTASPMLLSVTRRSSRRSLACIWAKRIASPIPMMSEQVKRYAIRPTTVPDIVQDQVAPRRDEEIVTSQVAEEGDEDGRSMAAQPHRAGDGSEQCDERQRVAHQRVEHDSEEARPPLVRRTTVRRLLCGFACLLRSAARDGSEEIERVAVLQRTRAFSSTGQRSLLE